jgi:hypothetical protein
MSAHLSNGRVAHSDCGRLELLGLSLGVGFSLEFWDLLLVFV